MLQIKARAEGALQKRCPQPCRTNNMAPKSLADPKGLLRPCQHTPPFLSNGIVRGTSRTHRSIRGVHRWSAVVVCQAADKWTVAVTGATGFVGSRLAAKLASQGHKVRVLTRNVPSAQSKLKLPGLEFFGPSQWADAIVGCDGVVNLAGEPIGTRWSPEIKKLIKTSRVDTTNAVVAAVSKCPPEKRPKVLVSASAVGFYGTSKTQSFNEESPSGSDYLSEVCREWEAAAKKVPSGVRVVVVRIGIVLAKDGGVLAKMLPTFQLFAGGPLGSGRQWVSWVHREDLIELIMESLRNSAYNGTYNATAPQPITMGELCSRLGMILGRPSWLPVPDFAINMLLQEGAQVVLEGQRVLPSRTQTNGFRFKFSEVDSALRSVLK